MVFFWIGSKRKVRGKMDMEFFILIVLGCKIKKRCIIEDEEDGDFGVEND